MGYVHDTQMYQFITPSQIVKTAGTWTDSASGGIVKSARTAAAAAFNLIIPVITPTNAVSTKGARFKSVEVYYRVETADLNSVTTVEMEKMYLPGSQTAGAVTGANPTLLLDGLNDTTAKRITMGYHNLYAILSAPVYIVNNEVFYVYMTFDAPATSVVSLYGARVAYELRL